MKRAFKILLLVIFMTFSSFSYAQVKVGLTGGVILSSLVRDASINANEGRIGYMAGVTTKIYMGEIGWFFEPSITYSLEGDNDQPVSFIKIPMKIGFDMTEGVNFHGIYYPAFLVGNQNGMKDFYNSFASIIGFGFDFYLSEHFDIGLNLNYGVSNLVSDPAGAKNFKVKPFTLDLYLTYFF